MILTINILLSALVFVGVGITLSYFTAIDILLTEATFLFFWSVFLLSVSGSFLNIPLTRSGKVCVKKKRFFGLLEKSVWLRQGVSLNIGGVVLPLIITGVFLSQFCLESFLVVLLIVTFFSFLGARFVENRGVLVRVALPVLYTSFFSVLLASESVVPFAFATGVVGVFLGADILHLPNALRRQGGALIIGGGGFLDAIFLVGFLSALVVYFS